MNFVNHDTGLVIFDVVAVAAGAITVDAFAAASVTDVHSSP